ncbi:pyruvate formate-lyase-activating protein [Microgenomates group bacterium]|nr:pyruvate formate-lyase-activating protein [Microgenomates group bacterium]
MTVKGSVNSIETLGLVDGPGVRVVVFLNGCKLRCKYCHNPEMQEMGKVNYTPEELVKKIREYKPYYGGEGGVTFSGGEPLLQGEFLIAVSKLLREENIHIALDTAGVGAGRYEEILENIDLVLLDIKHIERAGYRELTGAEMDEAEKFIKVMNKMEKKVWIRQVIVPRLNDSREYVEKLGEFLRKIKNIERVDFLPYHKMGEEKYERLGRESLYRGVEAMDEEKCAKLREGLEWEGMV